MSDTEEISLNAKQKLFRVVTPRSECLVMAADKSISGENLLVNNNTAFCSIFAGSLDAKSLAKSRRILVLHLTDIKNTKTKFFDKDHRLLASYGELPHLVRKGTADITIKSKNSSTPDVWALDVTGKRIAKVEVLKVENGFTFHADTNRKPQSTMAYEVFWNR